MPDPQKKKNGRQKPSLAWMIVVAVLVVGVGAGAYFLATRKRPGPLDVFARCLTAKGVKMYGAFWCPHCEEQKEMFGPSFEFVPYVECGVKGSHAQTQVCTQAGVKNYPTWVFSDGARVEGTLPLGALAQKTGCTLP